MLGGGGGGWKRGCSLAEFRGAQTSQSTSSASIACWLQIGKSKWKKILEAGEGIFQNRSQVDLKDKWRNLERQGIVAPVAPRLSDGQSPATMAAPGPQTVQMGHAGGATSQPGAPAMGGDGLQQGPPQAHPQQSHQHMGQHMMQVRLHSIVITKGVVRSYGSRGRRLEVLQRRRKAFDLRRGVVGRR